MKNLDNTHHKILFITNDKEYIENILPILYSYNFSIKIYNTIPLALEYIEKIM